MKKFVITSLFVIASSSVFATERCSTDKLVKDTAIGATVGGLAALVIPGVGPVLATSIVSGSAVAVVNNGTCAYEESKSSKNTYSEDVKEAILNLFK